METESEKRQERKALVNLGNAQLCSPGSSDVASLQQGLLGIALCGGLEALDLGTLICSTMMWYQ